MIRAARAEWTRLTRPRIVLWALAGAAGFAALITAVLLLTMSASATPGSLSARVMEQAGGGTLPVATGMSFASIAIFAAFVALSAGGFARGTWRAALLHQPRRWSLASGQFVARWAFVSLNCGAAMAVGWATALALAPSQGLDTSAWFTVDAARLHAEDLGRVVAFTAGWGLLGTLLGTVTRSVPIGLGIGLLWAGPLENVIGDELSSAQAWFPGLLLRAVLAPLSSEVDQTRVAGTLLGYAVVCLVVIGVVLRRRDVTS